jgi:hypothetical protein
MAKGRVLHGLEAAEKRLAVEIGDALRGGCSCQTRVASIARALAPHSPAIRGVLAEAARVLLKRGALDGDLYGASLRALADADDKRLPAILKLALAGDEAGNLPALSASCFVSDGALGPLLGRAAACSKAQISFGAEVARLCRGELSGTRLGSLAPKIKEAHRIAICVELLLPIIERPGWKIVWNGPHACQPSARGGDERRDGAGRARGDDPAGAANGASAHAHKPPLDARNGNGAPAPSLPVADALRVLQSAERHLGRWLVMAEIAHRAGDRRPLDEAIERSVSGPQSSRGAWSFVGWALDPSRVAPSARPTSEIVARLSHRPSADKDPAFLFRLGEASIDAAAPMLESMVKSRPLEDEVSVRAAYVLAKHYAVGSLVEPLRTAGEKAGRDAVRGVAAAALWDLGEKDRALGVAGSLAASASLEALAWSALVGIAAKRESNGDDAAKARVLEEPSFRRIHWGWPE